VLEKREMKGWLLCPDRKPFSFKWDCSHLNLVLTRKGLSFLFCMRRQEMEEEGGGRRGNVRVLTGKTCDTTGKGVKVLVMNMIMMSAMSTMNENDNDSGK